jgi:hypothetical protein
VSYNEWLDIDVLEDYLDGKLDAQTMHKVEKISLEDPFVAEALAGLSQSPKRTQTLSLLQKQLQQRIAEKPVLEKRWRITSHRLSIGAAAAVLFVTVSILFWMKQNNQRLQVAKNKQVDVKVAPQAAQLKTPVPVDSLKISAPANGYAAPKANGIARVRVNPPTVVKQIPLQIKTDTVTFVASAYARDKANALAEEQQTLARKKAATEREATANKESGRNSYTITLPDDQVALAKRKAETKTERPLPGKAEGIIATAQPGLIVPSATVNGRVYSKIDGQPLPGAIVRVSGTNKATTTNTKGEFTLPVDSTTQNLNIGYVGYTSQEVKAQANQSVNVALETNRVSLNEVVLTNLDKNWYEPARKSLIVSRPANAAPTGGWEGFEDYINANHRLYKEGSQSITVRFTVKKSGRPSHIKILSGLGKAENEEAVRLIKEGPSWSFQAPDQYATIGIKF